MDRSLAFISGTEINSHHLAPIWRLMCLLISMRGRCQGSIHVSVPGDAEPGRMSTDAEVSAPFLPNTLYPPPPKAKPRASLWSQSQPAYCLPEEHLQWPVSIGTERELAPPAPSISVPPSFSVFQQWSSSLNHEQPLSLPGLEPRQPETKEGGSQVPTGGSGERGFADLHGDTGGCLCL